MLDQLSHRQCPTPTRKTVLRTRCGCWLQTFKGNRFAYNIQPVPLLIPSKYADQYHASVRPVEGCFRMPVAFRDFGGNIESYYDSGREIRQVRASGNDFSYSTFDTTQTSIVWETLLGSITGACPGNHAMVCAQSLPNLIAQNVYHPVHIIYHATNRLRPHWTECQDKESRQMSPASQENWLQNNP